jgi:alpha-mannosidase
MKIPSLFYGSYIDVKKRLAVVCEQILKGKSFTSMLGQWRIIDSLTFDSGLYILRTHDDISIRQSNFHFTLFHKAFEDVNGVAEDPLIDEFFSQLLNYDWGLLLFAQAKDLWFGVNIIKDNSNRRIPYLKAVLKFSKELDREGERFIGEYGRKGNFWKCNSALQEILNESAAPKELLNLPLNEALFKNICRKILN